jgi:S-adenosyl-L-methionine hydrolase (adenosine-forming)
VNTITILTDFGLKDPYVGIMKGVMLAVNPDLTLVDITHEIGPQDVREASFLVPEYYRYFPQGTVHLCVVDPTVGSARKPLLLTRDGYFFVGPDNGLFSSLLDGATAYEISRRQFLLETISNTFHGRDIFAPAAAHLSRGIHPAEFGPIVAKPVKLRKDLSPITSGNTLLGQIIRFDHFGNAITNISFATLSEFLNGAPHVIELGDLTFRRVGRSYYEGDFTCVVGSSGYLEFGLFKGDLAETKGIRKGDRVTVRRLID